jgi:hypothetical protein
LGHRRQEVARRASGAYALVVVCEAEADRRTATALADRVLCEEIDWIEVESLDGLRTWRGLEEGSTHLAWKSLKARTLGAGFRGHFLHGHFLGEPGAPDALAARKALFLAAQTRPAAVVLVRDSDGQHERLRGLEQARGLPWEFPVLIAFAHPERESWVLAGFEPCSAAEASVLERLKRDLGFDPRMEADRLRAGDRDAKRVLAALTGGDFDRESACWAECGLDLLRQRGGMTGLTSYLEEVRRLLAPLFTGAAPSS